MKIKIFTGMMLIVIFLMFFTGILMFVCEKQNLFKEIRKKQILIVRGLERVVNDSILRNDTLFLINYLKTLKKNENSIEYIGINDLNGKCIAHTDSKYIGEIMQDTITINSLKSEELLIQNYITDTEKKKIEEISIPVFHGKNKKAFARIGFLEDVLEKALKEKLTDIRNRIILILFSGLILSIIISLIVAHNLVKPLNTLIFGMRSISKGKLDTKINLKTKDEISLVADEFNSMAEKLKELDEMKRDFVSSVTHELRSPLGVIETYINKLLDGGIEGFKETGVEDLIIMKNNTIRLTKFINDILDTAKIEAGRMDLNPEQTDIKLIVDDVLEFYKEVFKEKNIKLKKEIAQELPDVFIDKERIRQVFINLISNAVKFTPPGGEIKISVDLNGSDIVVSVYNTGIGMEERELKNCFEKFYQVRGNQVKKGTGLGLFIVKNIVELHGGKIWAESVPEQWIKFIFTLPLKNANIKN